MSKTLRLFMPQWQGGNNPNYALGAKLLAWLAPAAESSLLVEIPVESYTGKELENEGGIVGRSVLLKQLQSAKRTIEAHQPDKIVVFGGDCLVSQAPLDYLNKKYEGKLGVLWLDAHPDVSTPKMFGHAHAMVLGNLLGEGAEDFADEVEMPLNSNQVMYGGLNEMSSQEAEIVERLGICKASSEELSRNSDLVIEWIERNQIKHLAVHLDLDVLNPKLFRSLLFANPDGTVVNAPQGDMNLSQLSRLFADVSKHTEIVGFAIAEHLPWDAINIKNFFENISIFD